MSLVVPSSRLAIIEAFRQRIRTQQRQRLSQQELTELIADFLDALHHANTETEIQALCEAEIALLEEGYPQASVAKYMTVYRKAIAAAIAAGTLPLTQTNSHRFIRQQRMTGQQEERFEHWALTYLKYSPQVYETIDRRSQTTNRTKQLNLRLVPVEPYLALLQQLLTQSGPFEARWLAAAIAGLTGRRFAEVVAKGSFTLTDHPYLLRFDGQLKARATHTEGYNIVTLFPATVVLDALSRLRQLPEIQPIVALEGKALSVELNRFNQKLNTTCGPILMKVVPPLAGKTSVSVHNLRSLYGAIAVYFFCPPHQHEYAFVQHFLGHVMDSPATGHYFRFALCDAQHRLIRDKGIRLKEVPPLPLDTVELESPELEAVEPNAIETTQPSREDHQLTIFTEPLSPIETQDIDMTPQADWEVALERKLNAFRCDLDTQLQTVRQDNYIGWFIRRIEALEKENLELKAQLSTPKNSHTKHTDQTTPEILAQLEQLQAENLDLTQQLQAAQTKLEQFRQLLLGGEASRESAAVDTPDAPLSPPPKTTSSPTPTPTPSATAPQPVVERESSVKQPSRTRQTKSKAVAAAQSPAPQSPTPKKGRAFQRAEAIYAAIQAWNRKHPNESFAINAGLMETVFKIHRQAVKDFFEVFQNELWEYNQELGVESPRWHNRGKDTDKLKAFVSQQLEKSKA